MLAAHVWSSWALPLGLLVFQYVPYMVEHSLFATLSSHVLACSCSVCTAASHSLCHVLRTKCAKSKARIRVCSKQRVAFPIEGQIKSSNALPLGKRVPSKGLRLFVMTPLWHLASQSLQQRSRQPRSASSTARWWPRSVGPFHFA